MKKGIDQVYSPETLRRLQLVELDILKKFDAMCQKHGLEYFAVFGTLLGAVRHQGIIPWDDDIDIAVPRSSYEKIKELVPLEFGDGYAFLDGSVDPHYPFVTGRIMKKGTEFRMLSMKDVPCELGIFLDLFCFDELPEEKWKRRRVMAECWIVEKMIVLRNTPFPNLPYRGVKRLIVRTVCAAASLCLKPFPRAALHRWRKKAATRYMGQNTAYISSLHGIKPSVSTYRKDQVYPLQKLPYEDMMIPAPKDPHSQLVMNFGENYMTPLPEGKRSFIIPYKLSFGDENEEA